MRNPSLTELPPPPKGKTGWPWTEASPALPDTMPDGSSWPRVSIITPSYNQAQFIEETIRSVLLQGYPNLEYIIVDGGSTDGSVEIIRKYALWLAHWVSEKDKGQAEAINKGFRRARGDIVAWLNSDDTYLPRAVSAVVVAFVSKPEVSLIFGDCNIMDDDGQVTVMIRATDVGLPELLRTDPIPQPATFFRRQVLDTTGLLDTSFHYAMDYEFWLRIAQQHQIRHISQVLANFRMSRGSKSVSQLDKFYDDLVRIFERSAQDPRMVSYLPPTATERAGLAHYNIGVAYYGRGRMPQARQHLLQAARLYPALWLRSSLLVFLAKSLLGARLTTSLRHWRYMGSRIPGGR